MMIMTFDISTKISFQNVKRGSKKLWLYWVLISTSQNITHIDQSQLSFIYLFIQNLPKMCLQLQTSSSPHDSLNAYKTNCVQRLQLTANINMCLTISESVQGLSNIMFHAYLEAIYSGRSHKNVFTFLQY